ncbi:hypothetical protein M413DRAFT_448874 [Hebeloma cylindrosporum]|uniref:Uncharacterized protein n=1 Tax=Hebeloma cylindrosporum TaxID=76867 RepID=A0A0C2XFP0_HEBCY|nr:hypothetical protein M413DRAFT_448874 [Hebeloma cylindrosporum h7]
MSGSTPSPLSDESSLEGRRAFVNEAIAKDRLAAVSPRSALLSHSSLQTAPADEQSTGGALVDSGRQLRKRSTNASTGHRRKRGTGMELANQSALSQLLEVDTSRKNPRDEVMRLREILKTVERQAVAETRRTRELERANQEALRRVRLLNESNLAVQLEAAKTAQELRLYQLRLDNAQKEIESTQDAVKKIERERDEAEAEAARARAKARKLHQEKIAAVAREEGRRLGFEAGFEYARHESQAITARRPPPARQNLIENGPIDKGKRRARDQEDFQPIPETPPPRQHYINESPQTLAMSPSQLPLRGLPEMDLPRDPPPMQAGPSHGTPLRPFEPYPESDRGYHHPPPPLPMYPPQQQQHTRSKTPSIRRWSVEIPTQEELSHDYNTVENPNEIIKNLPREQWVTAQKHHELRGPPPAFPGNHPPPLLPHPPKPSSKRASLPPPTKAIKFPKMKGPLLAKTKEQAASWYRSLSIRKKNKPVIDPIPEESVDTPTTGGPRTGSTFNAGFSEPPTATTADHPPVGEAREMYGAPPRSSSSWYATKQQPPIFAPSVKSGYSRASTRVSEFDLLATPDVPAQSMRSGKEGPAKRMREKDSYLSIIKEDPGSRGNTPERPQALGSMPRARTSSSSFGQPIFSQHSLQQQSSSGAIGSSAENKRNSRRPPPPAIAVPDPDAALQPAGVAYMRDGINHYPSYPNGNLDRQPSRISQKTSPNTSQSIVIDVVPPSGLPPAVVNSPPHTGINHLSPYHTYQVHPTQSLTSLHTQGGTRVQSTAPAPSSPANRPGSAADSRHKSKQSLNNGFSHPGSMAYPSSPRPSQRPQPAASGHYFPAAPRPESVRSGVSKKMPKPRASQSSFVVVNPSPNQSPPSPPPPHVGQTPVGGGGLTLTAPLHRMGSSTSLRSTGSYSRYNPAEYQDPAFWDVDGPGPSGAPPPVQRPTSVNSGLSYV